MAIIQPSLPNFANGDTPSGDTVSDAYYKAEAPTPGVDGLAGRDILPSFEMVNGWMDDANLRDSAFPGTGGGWGDEQLITEEQIAPGSLTQWGQQGATANLDFFSELYANGTNPFTQPSVDYIEIPGAGITFQLPYRPSAICFTWQVFVGNDQPKTGSSITRGGGMKLFLVRSESILRDEQDRNITGQFRIVEESVSIDQTAPSSDELGGQSTIDGEFPAMNFLWEQRFRMRDRTWSGHYLWSREQPSRDNSVDFSNTNLSPEWYSATIKMWSESPHTRVRVRNMKYIAFK
jgi:hypothetical protein